MTTATLQYLGEGQFRAIRPEQCEGVAVGKAAAWKMVEKRSKKSHDQYFAAIHEAWSNLPESMADDFPSSEHLRKWALIKAGYCSITHIYCGGENAATIKNLLRDMDEYCILTEEPGLFVTIYRAHSQSEADMGRETFQKSKDDVANVLSPLVGYDILKHGGKSA